MRNLNKTAWQSTRPTLHLLRLTKNTAQIEDTCSRNSQSINQYQLNVNSTSISYAVPRYDLRTTRITKMSSRTYIQDSARLVSSLRITSLFFWHGDRFLHYIS